MVCFATNDYLVKIVVNNLIPKLIMVLINADVAGIFYYFLYLLLMRTFSGGPD